MINFFLVFFTTLFFAPLGSADDVSPYKIRALYNSLDRQSVMQHLAFYQLYSDTQEGKYSLKYAWDLLSGNEGSFDNDIKNLPDISLAIDSLVTLVNKNPATPKTELASRELQLINCLADHLPNRHLKGYHVLNEEDILLIPPDEIDLARALFLSELGNTEEAMRKIQSYEALIDLMALQLLARLPQPATPEQKSAR